MTSTLAIVISFVFQLGILLFVVRFLLQASGADFYNPLSQAIVKATDPICKPFRLLLRPFRNFDFASLVVAWLVAALSVTALYWLRSGALPPPIPVLWAGVIEMLLVMTNFYLLSVFIIVIASFVAQGNYHPALGLLHQIVEPIMAPIRKIIPPLGPLDLTPMVVILGIFVIQNLLSQALL